MKKYTLYKTVQLIFFVLIAVGLIAWIFPVTSVYHEIAHNSTLKLLAGSIWFVLLGSFVFILLDYVYFFGYLKDYKEMDVAIRSDPVSGIANRFSCDVIIEKYLNQPLPRNLGCMMIDLSNIQEINKQYGHIQGNLAIKDFSHMLSLSCIGLCFVGRNGGNKFLAIFEDSAPDAMDTFIARVNSRVATHNSDPKNPPIEIKYGTSYSNLDHVNDITELISLANSRIEYDAKMEDEFEFEAQPVAEAVVEEPAVEAVPATEVTVEESPVKAVAEEPVTEISPVAEAVVEEPAVETVPVVEAVAEPVMEAIEEIKAAEPELVFTTVDDNAAPVEETVAQSVVEEPAVEIASVVETVAEPVIETVEEIKAAEPELVFTTVDDNVAPVEETVAQSVVEEPAVEIAPVVEAVAEPVVEAVEEIKAAEAEMEFTPVTESSELTFVPVVDDAAPVAEPVNEAVLDQTAAEAEIEFVPAVAEPAAEPVVEFVKDHEETRVSDFDDLISEITSPVKSEDQTKSEPVEWVKVENPQVLLVESDMPVSKAESEISNDDKFASLIKALEGVDEKPASESVTEAVVEAVPVAEAVVEPAIEVAPVAEAVEESVIEVAPVVEAVEEPANEISPVAETVAEAVVEEPAIEIAPIVEAAIEPVKEVSIEKAEPVSSLDDILAEAIINPIFEARPISEAEFAAFLYKMHNPEPVMAVPSAVASGWYKF